MKIFIIGLFCLSTSFSTIAEDNTKAESKIVRAPASIEVPATQEKKISSQELATLKEMKKRVQNVILTKNFKPF